VKLQKALVLGLVVLACGDEDDDNACIFEGRYDFGYLSDMAECEPVSQQLPYAKHEEPCAQSYDDITLNGVPYNVFFSCLPGDPVVECEGFANYANGCSYDVYIRRVEP
jgi:hypothetical protein